MRLSVRRAKKLVDSRFPQQPIQAIKPHVLSEFYASEVQIEEKYFVVDEQISWTLSNPIKVSDFVQFFIFNDCRAVKVSEQISKTVDSVLLELDRLTKRKSTPPPSNLTRHSLFSTSVQALHKNNEAPGNVPELLENPKMSTCSVSEILGNLAPINSSLHEP